MLDSKVNIYTSKLLWYGQLQYCYRFIRTEHAKTNHATFAINNTIYQLHAALFTKVSYKHIQAGVDQW